MSEDVAKQAELVEVRPGIHAWVQPDGSWWLNNAGAITTAAGQLVVDTCATATRARRFLDTLADTTGQAPKLAVNTHQHGDHTYGNSLLPSTTTLIGQEKMREGLRVDPIIDGCPPFWSPVPDWGDVERRLPDVTITDALTVHLGDKRVELRHPGGPAHTTGDLIAWVPDDRVLFSGDLVFAGLTPLVFMGSVPGALAAVDWLAGFGPEVLVPGHGPILSGAEIERVLEEHRRYYGLVLRAGAHGVEQGLSPLEAARTVDLGEFAGWADAERIVLNLHRYYADHQGTELDLIAAFSDAVAYNGGPLPTRV
ncbi:MBL fold metallo-hydrolase [Actinoplanes ianthinogenes]|uniref:MBL fold metallo-hydrolase n=1 Tax=Actinoplanes ianthinogenes TaxID=122358 RepID=A0ABN6CS50_9ACTN|nr:MBL fold metallo-hydrolase [Actinoplanes ianthinogenes]BCJ47012.1 MBL fold metallo-hydrolase [Actinoplanes ianthinogenes]GGR13946.1 MBL fold metallo-hydrolase [Actinoplanes ianthinogenes]